MWPQWRCEFVVCRCEQKLCFQELSLKLSLRVLTAGQALASFNFQGVDTFFAEDEMSTIESGLRQGRGLDDRDEARIHAHALARLLSYAAGEAKSLQAPQTELMIWHCLSSLKQEMKLKIDTKIL